jgi:hypothetical protein
MDYMDYMDHMDKEELTMVERKRIVEQSYNQIAGRYIAVAARERANERARCTDSIVRNLSAGAAVLEMGYGVGGPPTQALAARFSLIRLDFSTHSVELVRQNVLNATLLHANLQALEFVPREEQPGSLAQIARCLRPSGLRVATMGASATEIGYEEDWLAAPLYWSHFDAAMNQGLVEEAGLVIASATLETAVEDGAPAPFLWLVARRSNERLEAAQ